MDQREDYTTLEYFIDQFDQIVKDVLAPYPGFNLNIDQYDSGLLAAYGIWNRTDFEQEDLHPGDHVRVSWDPEDPELVYIDRIPGAWPVRADAATDSQWDAVTHGEDYDQTDESLYDLAPEHWNLHLEDLIRE